MVAKDFEFLIVFGHMHGYVQNFGHFPNFVQYSAYIKKKSKIQKSVPWIFSYQTLVRVIKKRVEFWENFSGKNPKNEVTL